MAKLVMISAVAGVLGESFRRLGHGWPKTGTVVNAADFTEEEWDVLVNEPMLHIGPAPEGAEAAAAEAALREAIKDALGKLAPTDFDEQGLPKTDAVKKALPPKTKGVTAELVSDIWAELKGAA